MKIKLITVGKTATSYIKEGIELYSKRISRYINFEHIAIPDLKSTKSLTPELQKTREGEMILDAVGRGAWTILLDERGKEMTSRGFAEYIDRKMATLGKDIVFVVGGPYGFSEEVYAYADDKFSMSKLTFPHELVRLFFVEQLYRAFTILNGEPYHHD